MNVVVIPPVISALGTICKGLVYALEDLVVRGLVDLCDLVWVCLVLWHINHCRLFNAKSMFTHINSSISNNSV